MTALIYVAYALIAAVALVAVWHHERREQQRDNNDYL